MTGSECHENAVDLVARHFNGKVIVTRVTGKQGKEKHTFPDVSTETKDIEVEVMNHHLKFKAKAEKWDEHTEKILVVVLPPDLIKLFNEGYILNKNNEFIKLF